MRRALLVSQSFVGMGRLVAPVRYGEEDDTTEARVSRGGGFMVPGQRRRMRYDERIEASRRGRGWRG